MGVLSIGRLRSRRYVRVELKKSSMGWEFEKEAYNRVKHCFHKKVQFYSQPYKHQAICGSWVYLNINCIQIKYRGLGKTYQEK